MNQYGTELARIHHEAHADLARRAGPAIVSYLRRAGIRAGLIVDLGCGSGILARHLTGSGYDVLGVDPSRAMLRIAREMAPSATFVRSRAEDVALPACAAVVATGEALTYLPARTAPEPHLRGHIRRVSKALIDGGLFMFDAIVDGDPGTMTYRTWRAERDWAVLVDVAEDRRRRVVSRRITTFMRSGSNYRRSYVEHRVGVVTPSRVERELLAHGFIARTLQGYGSAPAGPRRVVFHAQLAAAAGRRHRGVRRAGGRS